MKTAFAALAALLASWQPARGDEACGWRNVDADRREVEPARVYWRSDFGRTNAFAVERLGGAEGTVRFEAGELVIEKTNWKGCFIVRGPSFPVADGTALRLAADVSVDGAEPDYSHGAIRLVAPDGALPLCTELPKWSPSSANQISNRCTICCDVSCCCGTALTAGRAVDCLRSSRPFWLMYLFT